MRRLLTAGGLAGVLAGVYALLVRGALTIDLGVGRRIRPLGPQRVTIAAPREVVFDVIAGPYRRTPRAMRDKLDVLERGEDLVLAAHHTALSFGQRATTVETVRLEPPHRFSFRLVRGPVPHVVETFELTCAADDTTELLYTGELGTDFWALGECWGRLVAASWERTVEASLAGAREEAERLARARAP